MKTSKRIVLYGNSVILGTVGASLKRFSRFEVTTLILPHKKTQSLDALKPDILVFDLDTTQTEEVCSFLKTNHAMLLIGVSPDVNLVQVWSGRQLRELSTQELLEVIFSEIRNSKTELDFDEDVSYQMEKSSY